MDRSEIILLKEAKQDGRAIIGTETVNGRIDERSNRLPRPVTILRMKCIHLSRSFFAGLTTPLAAQCLGSNKAGMAMKPASKCDALAQIPGYSCQINEDLLRYILSQVGVAIDESQGRGINQPRIPGNQFTEGIVGTSFTVVSEQLACVQTSK